MIYVTERELATMLGVDLKKWETVIAPALEARGLPRKDALFDNRRCWPAVREFILKRAMCKTTYEGQEDVRAGKTSVKKTPERGRDGAVILDLHRTRPKARLPADSSSDPRD